MLEKRKNKLIAIVGPTSSGKTYLAVKLAKHFNGEIVSADSRQVYRSMDIGTGKDLDKYNEVPYHLIDIVEPTEQFSLADYLKLAYKAIDEIINQGKLPILVGGTGLYVQAIVDGYDLADIKPDKKLREKLEKKSLGKLQKIVKKNGIELNESDLNNKRRLIRIIEKGTKGKEPFGKLKAEQEVKNSKYDVLMLGLKFPKKIIDERIDKRLLHRIEKQGMIEEVKRLLTQGVNWQRLDDFGLEYRFIAKHLKGELTYDEMLKQLSIASHQFAKRQMTWFSAHGGSASGGKPSRIKWIKKYLEAEKLTNDFLK